MLLKYIFYFLYWRLQKTVDTFRQLELYDELKMDSKTKGNAKLKKSNSNIERLWDKQLETKRNKEEQEHQGRE